jgi:hypothetical protein
MRSGKIKEPDEAILRRPLALPRVTAVVKAEVGAHSLLSMIERGISMLGTPVAIKRENLRMVAGEGRQREKGSDSYEAVGSGRLSLICEHVVRHDFHFSQEAAEV